jgi:hypothetical protein|tara:strand:- start:118 stop:465 length:348 start_codon:yes stop_codon:yes gene_type:complete
MANDFQTKELALTDAFQQLVNSDTSGEKTVHAIYFSNKDGTNNADVYLSLYDNDGSPAEKAKILHKVPVPAGSTLVVEKPINLTCSSTGTDARQLYAKASASGDIDAVASVLHIT